MAGLEKITAQILEKAHAEADSIMEKARHDADGILLTAKEEAADIETKAAAKAAQASESYAEQRKNTDEQSRKIALLKMRTAMIDDVLKESYSAVCGLDDEKYFAFLLKLVDDHAQPGEGVIRMNAKDLARVPADFAAKADEKAKAHGGSVKLDTETAMIDGGFILIYGDIEENCSVEAIFSSNKEAFQDKVQTILFK